MHLNFFHVQVRFILSDICATVCIFFIFGWGACERAMRLELAKKVLRN